MKVLLGEVSKAGRATKVERIVAGQEEILTALFERTYSMMSPVAQRVFLTLCNWRSAVPEVALEAVLLRPQNERMNVRTALDELVASSLVEEFGGPDAETFVQVPLAASLFGRRKLAASPWKVAVEADTELLQILGPAQKSDAKHGVDSRLYRLFRGAAKGILAGKRSLSEMVPMLELIARNHPVAWLYLVELYREVAPPDSPALIKSAMQHYLENPRGPVSALEAWQVLAKECSRTGDALGELHALSEISTLPDTPFDVISNVANHVNSILSSPQGTSIQREERDVLVRTIAASMDRHRDEFDAIDCSRLAWLYMRLGNEAKALELARHGLELDPTDVHCRRIVDRLAPSHFWH